MADSQFRFEPDPDRPGWFVWELLDRERFTAFLGPIRVRPEPGGLARCRMLPGVQHSNFAGMVHGGLILGFVDVALFAGARMLGFEHSGAAVTLEASTQFLGPGRIDEPLDAVLEIMRETGRMLFMRGLVEQEERKVAAFSAIVRKASRTP